MKTRTYNVYKFEELPEDVQEKAIDRLRDINVDHDWWDSTYEDAAMIGLRITEFGLDRDRHADGDFMTLGGATHCADLIVQNHGASCETHKTAKAFLADIAAIDAKYPKKDDEDSDDYSAHYDEVGMRSEDFLRELLEDYSIILQNEYDYLCSDEAIRETIEANDYDFTEEGVID